VPTCKPSAIKGGKLLSFCVVELRTLQKNEDLKTVFDIRSDKGPGDDHSLLLEIGKDYCCYAFWNSAAHSIDGLRFISFPEIEGADSLSKIISGIPRRNFQSVFICSAFPQALLVPMKYFNGNYEMLDIIYDLPAQVYKHDSIPDWQIVNIYAIPSGIHSVVENSFVSPTYMHVYTPALKVYNGYVADNQLSVHFTPHHFRVLLKKDSAIQLAQTYYYNTPLDVIYYLLKICYEFELEQSSVYIILSGLVEKQSGLYKDMDQYFANVHFAHPPEIKLPDNEHPYYFFTSLHNLATCVSSVEV
jgi:hypothetical protein